MKTPQEIITTLKVCGYGRHGGLLFDDTEVIKAMKEYAKEWVIIAVALAGAGRTVEANEATIKLLEGKIDAQ